MRIEKTEGKSVKQEKTNSDLVIETVKDYQSYDMNLEDAVKHTAKLLRMSEAEVSELISVVEKENDGNTITLESITCKLTNNELRFLENYISEASASDKADDEKGEEKKDGTGPHGKGDGPGNGKADGSGKEEEKKESVDEVIYTIEEDIDIPGTDITLEKGDKFIIVTEAEDEEDDEEDDEEEVEEKKKGGK